jgi:hypothetical protein
MGYVASMEEMRYAHKIFVRKSQGKKLLGHCFHLMVCGLLPVCDLIYMSPEILVSALCVYTYLPLLDKLLFYK